MEVPVPFSSLVYQMFAIAQANGVDGYEVTGIACEVFYPVPPEGRLVASGVAKHSWNSSSLP